MSKLPYIALGFLAGFFPGKFKWHIVYWLLILASFGLGVLSTTFSLTIH